MAQSVKSGIERGDADRSNSTVLMDLVSHGRLGEETIFLRSTSGGLEEVELVGWALCPRENTSGIPSGLKALGQLLYRLITGVPPSAQTAENEELEGFGWCF